MKTIYTMLAGLLLTVGSINAVAQMGGDENNPATQGSLLDSLDANGDGALDREEAGKAGLSDTAFDEADTNGDGTISEEEFDRMRAPGAGPQ